MARPTITLLRRLRTRTPRPRIMTTHPYRNTEVPYLRMRKPGSPLLNCTISLHIIPRIPALLSVLPLLVGLSTCLANPPKLNITGNPLWARTARTARKMLRRAFRTNLSANNIRNKLLHTTSLGLFAGTILARPMAIDLSENRVSALVQRP